MHPTMQRSSCHTNDGFLSGGSGLALTFALSISENMFQEKKGRFLHAAFESNADVAFRRVMRMTVMCSLDLCQTY